MIIRREQMEVFRKLTMEAFENEMVAHSKDFSPRLCEVIGEKQLRVALRAAIDRAREYGFTNRGPIRLFIELRFLFGSAFDTDPQYPWAAEILRGAAHQMLRAEELRDKTIHYQEKVSGAGGANTRNALKEIFVLAQQASLPSPVDFTSAILKEMDRVFPQKAAYTGEEGLQALISEARAQAQKYCFPTTRGDALLAILMFAFGHGCTDDPLYPWISRTLNDDRITDPAGRADRLERKALTWLSHVLARSSEREHRRE